MPGNERNRWQQVGRYSALAFLLPASTFMGYLIGWLLDRVFGTSFLSVVFLLLGIAAGFVEMVRMVQKDFGPRGE
jgi:F0F1-type ATP synthase assembly protein I